MSYIYFIRFITNTDHLYVHICYKFEKLFHSSLHDVVTQTKNVIAFHLQNTYNVIGTTSAERGHTVGTEN